MSSTETAPPHTPKHVPRETDAPSGPFWWASLAVGMGMLTFGLYGFLKHSDQTQPVNWLKFFVGSVLVHDAVWAPAVGLASLLFVRVVPRRVRPSLQGTLIVSVAAILVVIPAWTGRGRPGNNPSILPGDYGPDLLKVLAVVWLVGGLCAIRALRRPATAVDPAGPPDLPPVQPGW